MTKDELLGEDEHGSRAQQYSLLDSYLNSISYPTAVGVHGPPSTGKSFTLRQVLEKTQISYSWVDACQCATVRILLQRALRQILENTATGQAEDAICENVEVFATVLQHFFAKSNYTERHVLVLDQIDRLSDPATDLYNCLPRLPELMALYNLVVVFVYSSPEPRPLITANVPHVYFPRYTLEDATRLLYTMSIAHSGRTFPRELTALPEARAVDFWQQFLRIVVVALNPYAGTDLRLLWRIVQRVWPIFIDGYTGRDFNKQYSLKSHVFRNEGFLDHLADKDDKTSGQTLSTTEQYLLCAAYLASYNSPRYDVRFFSRAKDARAKRRATRPQKAINIPARSLAAPTFELERFLAIYRALLPDADTFVPTTKLGTSLASLTAQNMIVREGNALDSRTKWRINVSWSFIQEIADDLNFPIEHYIVE